MRYFDVTATKNDETYPLLFDHVSEWSLKQLVGFYRRIDPAVQLHAELSYQIDDKPQFYKDEETGEVLPNTGQVF